MLDALMVLFKKETSFEGISKAINLIAELVSLFESDYLKDKDAKNAAIDAVIQLLEQHKDK